jgi:hypothetical protein
VTDVRTSRIGFGGWRTLRRGTGVTAARLKLAGCRIFSALSAEKVRVLTCS